MIKLDPLKMSSAPSSPLARIGFWCLLRLWIFAFCSGTLHWCWGALYFLLPPPKNIFCEVLFCFVHPLLLTAVAICASVDGGSGNDTGAISRGSMLDVWEGKKWGWWLNFLDGSCWTILVKIDTSSARNWCAEDELLGVSLKVLLEIGKKACFFNETRHSHWWL